METFDQKLAAFAEDMRAKIIQVAWKYGGIDSPRSVTSDKFDWACNEVASAVREHLLKEIAEWILAKDSPNDRKELVDIANCAFILSEMSKEGAI